jgi:precorrin-6A/cobalt-precorrin-6A reductase
MGSFVARSSGVGVCQRLLVIGGTGDAAKLVRLVAGKFGSRLEITTSLAGRTCFPTPLPCDVRIGGFGGASGLARWITENGVELVIDATHPFSAVMSENTRAACKATGARRLVLGRAQWTPKIDDRWHSVKDVAAAARLVPKLGQRPFLTVGGGDVSCFSVLGSMRVVVRLIDKPSEPLPLANYELVLGRGPFELAQEEKLLKKHKVDVVVAKNSGGQATYAKIEAARKAQIPVIMIERPPVVKGERVEQLSCAVSWIEERLK